MKIFLFLIFFFLFSSCSFDNKSGIWQNNNKIDAKREGRFKDFITLNTSEKLFNETIPYPTNFEISFDKITNSVFWTDEFYNDSNNFDNFNFNNTNKIIYKSKKLSKFQTKKNILFDGKNLIINDIKGNIIIYSINNEQIILKYNFYKKKYKRIKKKLNTIVENNIVYVSDNLGYIYALDYNRKKILWGKNFKIPFRSNLKLLENKLVLADQDNNLHILNKISGEKLKTFPTEEAVIKNDFVNTLALDNKNLFYLNTYGSLYSISINKPKINWFMNLNQSVDIDINSLFYSNPVIVYNDKIIVSTDPYLYILSTLNGSTIFKKAITSIVKPVISNEKLYLISNNNLLVCINSKNGKIIYSLDIIEKIANFLGTKKRSITINYLYVANNNIMVFLENSYVVKMNSSAKIQSIDKFKEKVGSQPIFIDGSILYLSKNNKLIINN